MSPTPQSDIDLYSDETLSQTEVVYRSLRDRGPIVFLPANNLYVVTHFDAVRAALRADETLISGKGVAANDFINNTTMATTLGSDGETHDRRRAVLMRPLGPRALEKVKQRIEESADRLVQDLRARGGFCGVRDFASHLPVSIVADLVGLEEDGRENMLVWAAATFDALGPLNARAQQALQVALGLREYARQLGPDKVKSSGWAAHIFAAHENGEVSIEEAVSMVLDYTAPSLDTTILATGHMLWRLGVTPNAFSALRSDPGLAPSVVNESVRLASPIRGFTRYACRDYVTDAGTIPAGSRAVMLYASANWDERRYQDAHQFHVHRNPRDHVGWGHGAHTCAGMHLARLEMEALARALARHVERIEVGEPAPIMNNVLQGFARMDVTFH
ncbi:MAG: cytochrome P450 [Caulobacterales bacterium]|nr:cytochrome P450 [Caulobacterales bacterium]